MLPQDYQEPEEATEGTYDRRPCGFPLPGQERHADGGTTLGEVHGACGCQVQQDLPCAAAEDHTPCVSAHFLLQHGKVRNEPQDAAVYHGTQRYQCDAEHLHARSFR